MPEVAPERVEVGDVDRMVAGEIGSVIVTWVALALILGGAAFYVVESGMLGANPQQAGQHYPRGL